MTTLAWVIGRGGLLGSHVAATLGQSSAFFRVGRPRGAPFPGRTANAWTHASRKPFTASWKPRAAIGPASVFWCAGSGVVATPAAEMAAESETWERFLARLGSELARRPRSRRPLSVVFASSAGAIYGGGSGSPPHRRIIDAPGVPLRRGQAATGEGARALGGSPTRGLHPRGPHRQPLRTGPASRQTSRPHLADVALPDPPPARSHLRAARHRPRFRVRRGRRTRARAVDGAARPRGGAAPGGASTS